MRIVVFFAAAAGLMPPSHAELWRKAGLDSQQASKTKVDWRMAKEGHMAIVDVTYTLGGISGGPLKKSGAAASVPCTVRYLISEDEIVIETEVDIKSSLLPNVPRLGHKLALPKSSTQITYYGKEGETYDDRKEAGPLGIHSLQVADTHVDYIVPSENGNRADTRWVSLQNKNGVGLAVAASPGEVISFSAHDYDIISLDKAQEARYLARGQEEVTLTVDHMQMGVGGDDSWSRSVKPEHLISHGLYKWGIRLIPLASKDTITEAVLPKHYANEEASGEYRHAPATFAPGKTGSFSWFWLLTLLVCCIAMAANYPEITEKVLPFLQALSATGTQ